jgi:Single-strand binding protein family
MAISLLSIAASPQQGIIMTLHAACYAQAFKDAEVKESKSGTQYGSLLVTVPNGTDEEGRDQHLFIRLLAFQENVDELAKIKRNDRCYAEGVLSVSIYQSDKGPRPDLTLKAHHIRRSAIGKVRPKREPDQGGTPSFADPVTRHRPPIQGRDSFDLNDALPF